MKKPKSPEASRPGKQKVAPPSASPALITSMDGVFRQTRPVTSVLPKVQAVAPHNDSLYTYELRVVVADETLVVRGDKPMTRPEIETKMLSVRNNGAVFLSPDKLTTTTYMPLHICKLVLILTPFVGGE
jgi:hypothetical protein